MTGAAVGAAGGPIGIAVGAAIGAIAGGLAGKGVAEMVDPTVEDAYWEKIIARSSTLRTQDMRIIALLIELVTKASRPTGPQAASSMKLSPR